MIPWDPNDPQGPVTFPWDPPPAMPLDPAAVGAPGLAPAAAAMPLAPPVPGPPPVDLAPPAPSPAPAAVSPPPLPLPYGVSVPIAPPASVVVAPAPPPDISAGWAAELPSPALAPAIGAYGAYTGGAQSSTPTPEQRQLATAQHYQQHPDQLLQQLAAGPVDADTQQYLDAMAVRDPQGFAELNYRLADSKVKQAAAEQARINNADYEAQKANIAMRNQAISEAQAKSAQIDAEATRLANTQIGPHMSMFQRVSGVLGAVIGGLVQAKTGSARNAGLDALNDTINRDLTEQHAQLANQRELLGQRRNAVSEQYARSGDLYQANEVARLAALKYADEQLATQQQNFAPDGTRGMQIAGLRAGIAGQIVANQLARQDKDTELGIKKLDAARQIAQEQEAERHNRETERAERDKLAIERQKAAKEGQALTPDQLRAIMTVPGQPPPVVPPVPMTMKDYRENYLPAVKSGQEAGLGAREYSVGDVRPIRDTDGNIIGYESKPLVNADGKLFQAPSTKEAEGLRHQIAGVNSANKLIGDIVSNIEKNGGSSSFFKKENNQAMQATKESLLFALHQGYGVEGFRPGVLEQMEKALGGQDPTAYAWLQQNAIPGLKTAKKDLNTHLNSNLTAAGYAGKEYSPPDLTPPPELPTLSDRTLAESGPGLIDKMGAGLRADGEALINPTGGNPNEGAGPELGPPVGPTGLSVRNTEMVQDMVKSYQKGTPATKERIAAHLSAALGAGRPGLNTGVLGLVAGEAPELYQQLLQALPPDQREAELRNQAALRQLAPQLPGGR